MDSAKDRSPAADLLDPPASAGPAHYAAAMTLVAAVFGGALVAFGHALPPDAASPPQDAVMVDLPPIEAGTHPRGDEAPPQTAAPAAAGAEAPQTPPKPPEDVAAPTPPTPEVEKVPQAPAADAVVEQQAAPTPQAQAPTSAPKDAHEEGAPTPAKAQTDDADDSETRRTAAAHLITLWQRAMMGRLQAARHELAATHATGIAKIAFAIDRDGRLISAHIAHGSGSATVDAAALSLVRRAAPFPTPPAGVRDAELTFVVPISFRRGD